MTTKKISCSWSYTNQVVKHIEWAFPELVAVLPLAAWVLNISWSYQTAVFTFPLPQSTDRWRGIIAIKLHKTNKWANPLQKFIKAFIQAFFKGIL